LCAILALVKEQHDWSAISGTQLNPEEQQGRNKTLHFSIIFQIQRKKPFVDIFKIKTTIRCQCCDNGIEARDMVHTTFFLWEIN
jgi:hypothetical protein